MNEPIIDAHHHIWRKAETPWLNGPPLPRIFGDYEAIRRDYLVEDYLADARPSGVVKSVYIQVNVAPGREVEEVEWVASVAAKAGFPHAIAAFADLAAPDVADVLDRECAAGNVRAIRQQLHWHEKPLYRFASRPDLFDDPAWRRGLGEVQRRGLAFELQVFTSQMAGAAALAHAFPETTFILQHAGMLEDKSPAGVEAWRAGMRELAGCPNICSKISGLGTFERACSEASWRPIIEETVDLFGPGRCLFGSNFPIERLWTTYDQIVGAVRASLGRYTDEERRAVFHDTAARIYRL